MNMTDKRFDLAAAMKGQQWERCKGELRALIALQGSYHSYGDGTDYYERMVSLRKAVDVFIEEVEGEAWVE